MNFGTLQNVSVSLKEMMHGVYKRVITHTNKKNVEMDLIKRDNTLQALRYILDNGYDSRVPQGAGNCVKSITKDVRLRCLLEGWYISTLVRHKTDLTEGQTVDEQDRDG
jgi:hypothetical protein